jgi:subtilisin-like proprotein convertase family protein
MRSQPRTREWRAIGTAGVPLLVITLLVAAMAAPAGALTFSNTGAITIPGTPGDTFGPANPYPSTITVSGLAGTIVDVNVTLSGFGHAYPDDVDVLLVGPFGQNVILMTDCGGFNSVTNVNLTIDGQAGQMLPDTGTITSGSYAPTPNGTFDGTSPAPSGPYGLMLSGFNGTNPNGAWQLWVYDDATFQTGAISGGWSLDITTNGPTITSFTPTSGPPETVVTITGTNLTGATAVTFGSVAATAFTVNSPTQITATVPTGAVTGPIAVTTPTGTGTSAMNFTVTVSSHARNVSLNLPGIKAKGLVTVQDGFTACAASVPVKLQRLVYGSWRNVASLSTGASGAFRVGGVTDAGKYRAVAKKVTLASGDTCLKATSPTVRN